MGFDLKLTEEQEALRAALHELAAEVLRPAARECEAAKQTSEPIWRQIHESGFTAPVDGASAGRRTPEPITHCIAAEELAWGDPGIAYQVLGSGLAAVVIARGGSDEQKARYLPLFLEPTPTRSFVALAEKVAAGDLEELETTVDGGKVAGEKYGVLNASDAAVGVVVGRANSGIGAALVDADAGYQVVKPEDKLGLEAAPTSVVRFDLQADPLPSNPELTQAILWAKLATGAIAVGCARASLEYASKYATQREAFGKAIGAFQGVSFKIADMATAVDAARLLVWRAAWKIERGTARPSDIAEANVAALHAAVRCGDDAVQVLGGHGYMRDHPVEMWFRDAVTLSAFEAPDVLGDLLVARSVLPGLES